MPAGGVIVQGAADLTEVKASMSKRQRAVLVRLVFRGHGEDVLARIAGVQRLGGSRGDVLRAPSGRARLRLYHGQAYPALREG